MNDEKKLIDPIIPNEESKPLIQVGSNFINPNTGLIEPMEFTDRHKDFEEKTYIILYQHSNDMELEEMYDRVYSVCIGRTEAYLDIKDKLESGLDIDIHKSIVITETMQTETASGNKRYFLMALSDCITVYSFCTAVKENFPNDTFDIEDYNINGVPDEPNVLMKKQPLTAEQQEYRKLLDASMARDKFFETFKKDDKDGVEGHNI